ncbi:MAG: YfhO family protein, partial [Acidobacteriota bacterium]|nr:YfhO family protein [Acidobacteriota bacterium]
MPPKSQLARLYPLLVLLLEALLFYRKILFLPAHWTIPWDFRFYHLPLTSFIEASLRRGQFPLWDPYTYCGYPFFANINAQLFYPPTWLAILASLAIGGDHLAYLMELQLVAHVVAGGCFTYLLLRALAANRIPALIGASVFELGPYFASQAQHLGAIDGAAWIPLACLSVVRLSQGRSRRWIAALAASLALSILAGFPSTAAAAFICSFTLAILLSKSRLRLLADYALAAVLGIGLSLVQLLPTMQATSLSVSQFRRDFRGHGWGVPLQALVSLVWPNYYHLFDLNNYRMPWNPTFLYLYCGIAALLLAATALVLRKKYAGVFAIITLLSLFLMLGEQTPPGRWILPSFLDLTRDSVYVEFLLAGFTLGIAVLAGLGADALAGTRHPLGLAVLAVVCAELIWAGSSRPMNTGSRDAEPGVSRTQFDGSPELLRKMRELTGQSTPPDRFDLYDDWSGWVTTASMTELPAANGNDPFALYRFLQVRLFFTHGERWGRYYEVGDIESRWLDFLNVKYLLSRKPLPDTSKWTLSARLPGRDVYENRSMLPRFYLVSRVQAAADMAEALAKMWTVDPTTAVVEGDLFMQSGPPGFVRVIRYEPTLVELETDSATSAYLVTSEANYPGWHAWIDGEEEPIHYTNVAFRGLPVPPGMHKVTFRFAPPILTWSAFLTLLTLATTLSVVGRAPRPA